MSLTYVTSPSDACMTRIWVEGEFLEENNSFEENLGIQSKHSFLEPWDSCLRDLKNRLEFLQRLHLHSKKGHADIRSQSLLRG